MFRRLTCGFAGVVLSGGTEPGVSADSSVVTPLTCGNRHPGGVLAEGCQHSANTRPRVTGQADPVTDREWASVLCRCCDIRLPYFVGPGPIPTEARCADCATHGGTDPETRLRRAEEHETRLRAHLVTCSENNRKRQAQAKQQGEQVGSALGTRDAVLAVLGQVRDRHQPRTGNLCACGTRDCPDAAALTASWLRAAIDRVERHGEDRP